MAEIDFEAEGLLDGLEGRAREAPAEVAQRARRGRRVARGAEARRRRGQARAAPCRARPARRRAPLHPRRGRREGRARRRLPRAPVAGARAWRWSDDDEPAFTEHDVDAARRIAVLRDAGVPDDGHPRGGAPARDDDVAARSGEPAPDRRGVRRARATPSTRSRSASRSPPRRSRRCSASRSTTSSTSTCVEQIRHDASAPRPVAGRSSAQEVTVGFADLVGFTRLGETAGPRASWARSPGASASWPPRWSSRRCGWSS